MIQRLLTAVVFIVLFVPAAWAQNGTVTGTVTDAESGSTIPGANAVLEEASLGASTNANGVYTIEDVPAGTYTLRVSFVGYDPTETEVTVEEGATVTQDVQLSASTVGLDEVVVTGYTSQRRSDLSGSISSISAEEVQNLPVQNTESLLQGRAAGVTVSTTSGNPGGGFEVNIRGRSSINFSSDPLYIVDGVQISTSQNASLTDRSPLNAIAPSDIESIEVLKDAATAAIYGAQAANGVVIITTKSGRQGETRVNLTYEGGRRFQSNRFDMMNRDEWIDFQIDAFGEDGFREDILPAFGYAEDADFNTLADYDWQDFIFDPGWHQEVGFSATGGNASTQFFISGKWTSTEAAVQKVDYEAYNFRMNINQRLTDAFNIDARLALNNNDQPGVCQDGFFINCPFYQSIGEEPPISFPFLENGDYNPNTEQSATTNPALVLNEEERSVNVTQIIGNIQPTYSFTDWLFFRGTFGIDWQNLKEDDYESTVRAPADGGFIRRRFNTVTNMNFNGVLNASQTFNDIHDVSGLVGIEYRREYLSEDDNGFIGINNDILKVPDAATENSFFQGFNTEFRLLSYFAQANYNFDDRYILKLTGRVDGSSRFGENQRFGFFPSGSAAWRIAQEDFFNVDWVDDLKVRVGYGIVGSSIVGDPDTELGNFGARGIYAVDGSYVGQVGFRPEQLENPELTWEESREVNLGADWGLFNGRITGSLDLYRKNSDGLLLDFPLPDESGYVEVLDNSATVRNQGIELFLRTINVQTTDFLWSTRFNVSVNQNEVTDLGEGIDGEPLQSLDAGDNLPVAVGRPIEGWNVPIWAGVNPADGRPLWYDADGNLTYEPDVEDWQAFDGGEEDVVGGFGSRFDYKGLSLDVFFDFSYGGTALPNTQRTWSQAFGEGILGFLAEDRWREPGDIAEYPRSTPFGLFDTANSPAGITSLWLYSNNYVRMRSATLSYRLPPQLMDRVGLRGARVYLSGINLFTWSSYLGIDPEVEGAFEESSYPAEQQVNVGIELNL